MKTQTIYREMPYPECKPEREGNYTAYCSAQLAHASYWNGREFMMSESHPHYIRVVTWLKPEVVEEGKEVDYEKIWNDLMLPIHPVVDLAEMGLMPEVKNMCMIAMQEAVRQDRLKRIVLPEECGKVQAQDYHNKNGTALSECAIFAEGFNDCLEQVKKLNNIQ